MLRPVQSAGCKEAVDTACEVVFPSFLNNPHKNRREDIDQKWQSPPTTFFLWEGVRTACLLLLSCDLMSPSGFSWSGGLAQRGSSNQPCSTPAFNELKYEVWWQFNHPWRSFTVEGRGDYEAIRPQIVADKSNGQQTLVSSGQGQCPVGGVSILNGETRATWNVKGGGCTTWKKVWRHFRCVPPAKSRRNNPTGLSVSLSVKHPEKMSPGSLLSESDSSFQASELFDVTSW